ncbi:hypothetical protein EPO05_02615 [Patescibacteria group bacterium]|nr:MAG: hypothetical protein EPO05_02615 [Patescibacteria group bacterium]
MHKEKMSVVLMGLSVLTLVMAAYVFFTQQSVFGIAGTQWVLVSIVLGVYAVFVVNCPCCQGGSCCSSEEKK